MMFSLFLEENLLFLLDITQHGLNIHPSPSAQARRVITVILLLDSCVIGLSSMNVQWTEILITSLSPLVIS